MREAFEHDDVLERALHARKLAIDAEALAPVGVQRLVHPYVGHGALQQGFRGAAPGPRRGLRPRTPVREKSSLADDAAALLVEQDALGLERGPDRLDRIVRVAGAAH